VKDYLNINEAAKATGLSIPTIRAKLAKDLLPNAHQVPEGKRQTWRIPLSDLQAAGLLDKVSSPKQPSETEAKELKETALISEIDRLETALKAKDELLRLTTQTLEDYRARERQLFLALETKQTQEQRRFSWFRRNP
jgi:hypothetical protein